MSARERGAGCERGATLIIALVFVAVIGLLASILIAMTFTGSRSTYAYRQERVLRYNAESAINQAIMKLQGNTGHILSPTSRCINFPTMEKPAPGQDPVISPNKPFLYVTCQATPGAITAAGARDVTIKVICVGATFDGDQIECGDGSLVPPVGRLLGSARVRFEVPTDNPAAGGIIPKIVTWDTQP